MIPSPPCSEEPYDGGDNAHSYIQCNFQHISNFPTHIGKKFDIEKILKIFNASDFLIHNFNDLEQ